MYQIKTTWQRIKALFELWIIDHEFVRSLYRNFYQIDSNAYRSSHPSPRFIKKLKKQYDINTIINLRGANNTGQYKLELEACKKQNIKLLTTPFSSRRAPSKARILAFFNALETASYPIVLHCKSGADRAGLASALYQLHKNNINLDLSKQLNIKYGHFKSSETGVLDHFIETWKQYHQENPDISFLDWVQNDYNPEEVNKTFHASRLGNVLVNKILRRE